MLQLLQEGPFKRAGLPVVEVMDLTDRPIAMNVGFSHHEVGVAVARYLCQKGYQRIAYAGTLTEIDFRSVKRIAGFQQTLAVPEFGVETETQVSEMVILAFNIPSKVVFGMCSRSIAEPRASSIALRCFGISPAFPRTKLWDVTNACPAS